MATPTAQTSPPSVPVGSLKDSNTALSAHGSVENLEEGEIEEATPNNGTSHFKHFTEKYSSTPVFLTPKIGAMRLSFRVLKE